MGFKKTVQMIREGGHTAIEIYNRTTSDLDLNDYESERLLQMIRAMQKADNDFLDDILREEE